jgi:SAM-dependent methyltransferase
MSDSDPGEPVTPASLREAARYVYGSDPAGYARGRPDYPEEVYDVLRGRCGLGSGSEVVEIGPGTGLVTRRLLAYGAQVVAVEPDAGMAEFLTGTLGGPHLEVLAGTFEQVALPMDAFDLAVAATSFHWVDQAAGLPKLGRIVRPGGWVALWWTIFDDPDRPDPFRDATTRLLGDSDLGGQRRRSSFQLDTAQRSRDLERLGGFEGVRSVLVRSAVRFTSAQIRAFYGSLIEVRRRPPAERCSLLDRIQEIAEQDFGGEVTRLFVTVLYTGQRPRSRPRWRDRGPLPVPGRR